MPNHITNLIDVQDEKNTTEPLVSTGKFAQAVKGEKSDFDFEKVIPMPKELHGTRSPASIVPDDKYDEEVAKVKNTNEKNPGFDMSLPISQSMSDDYLKRFGANNWYDWSVKNWGTKWDAYEVSTDGLGHFEFQTAWSHPFPVVKKLSEMFPTLTFYVAYADEDRGSNLGLYKIKNGKVLSDIDIEHYALAVLADSIWDGNQHIEQLEDDDEE